MCKLKRLKVVNVRVREGRKYILPPKLLSLRTYVSWISTLLSSTNPTYAICSPHQSVSGILSLPVPTIMLVVSHHDFCPPILPPQQASHSGEKVDPLGVGTPIRCVCVCCATKFAPATSPTLFLAQIPQASCYLSISR